MQCELPEDWNPNKIPRNGLLQMGYTLRETCRSGRSMYETWGKNTKDGTVYHLLQYRWCDQDGWDVVLTAPHLEAVRDDIL